MADKKSNLSLIIIGSSFGVLLLGFAIYVAVLLLAAPSVNKTPAGGQDPSADKNVSISQVPEIMSFEVTRDTDSSTTATAVAVLADGDYQAQYEILDVNKKTITRGNVPVERTITEVVELVNGGNSFTFRVRVEGDGAYSEYVSSKPSIITVQGLPETEGINVNAEPNSEYFNTAWSKGEGGTENLSLAVQVAWGAEAVTIEDYCLPLNDATISPSELFPPLPSTTPEDLKLKFDIFPALNGQIQLYYYWCDQPS